MADTFDPYYKWLGIPPTEQPANHYRLLGLTVVESDADVIENAADQRMAHLRTLQSGKYGALSQKLLNELSKARICLLDADKKAAYDANLKAELNPATVPKEVAPTLEPAQSQLGLPLSPPAASEPVASAPLPKAVLMPQPTILPRLLEDLAEYGKPPTHESIAQRTKPPLRKFNLLEVAQRRITLANVNMPLWALVIGLGAPAIILLLLIIGVMTSNSPGRESEAVANVDPHADQREVAEDQRKTEVSSPSGEMLINSAEDVAGTNTEVEVKEVDPETNPSITASPGAADDIATKTDSNTLSATAGDQSRLTVMLRREVTTSLVRCLSFFPDGKSLLLGDVSKGIWILGLESQKDFPKLIVRQTNTYDIGVFQDGQTLASTRSDNFLRLWNSNNGVSLGEIPLHYGPGRAFEMSPDGEHFASISIAQRAPVEVIDRESKDCRELRVDTSRTMGRLTALAMSNDGKQVAASGEFGEIAVWDFQGGRLLWSDRTKGYIFGLAFSADRRTLGALRRNALELWDIEQGRKRISLDLGDTAVSLVFHPRLPVVFTGDDRGVLCVWQTQSGKLLQQLEKHDGRIYPIAISKDGKTLASADRKSTKIWDIRPIDLIDQSQDVAQVKTVESTAAAIASDDQPDKFTHNDADVVTPPKQPREPPSQQDETAALAALAKIGARITSGGAHVRIQGNTITDEDLVHLAKLKQVHNLGISHTPITDASLAHISELKQLRSLVLYRTKVTADGLRHLTGLGNLESLNVGLSNLSAEALEHISKLRGLQHLTLPRVPFDADSMGYLEQLPNLKTISMDECQLGEDSLARLKNLKSVEQLQFPRTASGESLKYVTQMPSLKKLTIGDNHVISGGLRQLHNVEGLLRLAIKRTNGGGDFDEALLDLRYINVPELEISTSLLTDKGLVHLKNIMALRNLQIMNSQNVTDAGLVHLHGLTNLSSVSISSTSTAVTEKGRAELRKQLPDCRIP